VAAGAGARLVGVAAVPGRAPGAPDRRCPGAPVGNRAVLDELLSIAKRDRARRSRWRKFGAFLGAFIEGKLTAFLTSLFGGWLLMLAVEVAHDHWIPQLPTIGYWWAVLIYFLLPTPATSSKKRSDGAR